MKKKLLICALAIIIVVLIVNYGFLNRMIFVTRYDIHSDKIANTADTAIKIVQMSDIHGIRSEQQKDKLVSKIKDEAPDLIFIAGDLVDADRYTEQNELYQQGEITQIEALTVQFLSELTDFAEVYYVYGNHEIRLMDDDPLNNPFKLDLENVGVHILNNSVETLTVKGCELNLVGMQDPATLEEDEKYADLDSKEEIVQAVLDDLLGDNAAFNKEAFTILIAHRPEYFDLFASHDIDLAFTGHTHGGVMILPFIGSLYSRGEGLFPKYGAGIFSQDDFTMIINRGLAYPGVPLRIFDPPEIVVATLSN